MAFIEFDGFQIFPNHPTPVTGVIVNAFRAVVIRNFIQDNLFIIYIMTTAKRGMAIEGEYFPVLSFTGLMKFTTGT